MKNDARWITDLCDSYASKALWFAELFIYLGLLMGVIMAAAEAYKLYREAAALKPTGTHAAGAAPARATAVGEVIKGLTGVLTGAKAWLPSLSSASCCFGSQATLSQTSARTTRRRHRRALRSRTAPPVHHRLPEPAEKMPETGLHPSQL